MGGANLSRAIRINHSLMVELQEILAKKIREMIMLQSVIFDFSHPSCHSSRRHHFTSHLAAAVCSAFVGTIGSDEMSLSILLGRAAELLTPCRRRPRNHLSCFCSFAICASQPPRQPPETRLRAARFNIPMLQKEVGKKKLKSYNMVVKK